ncbi:hypothetical protein [Pedobacter sp. BMA]|uniref:hypothetical protein n=1 Tax=Pedobacter sp. BMA TaxID=1663685 RepID=UPI00064B6B71|nr:hypothetical protein [Pedobacter sp. BMA]KLT63882.1 hypothetical protein AB669_19310 [Pedobacter sp. BMA]
MKTLLITSLSILIFGSALVLNVQNDPSKNKKEKQSLASIASKHKQLYGMSCIPMSVEMVLKYNNRVAANYYKLQNDWKNKADGTFGNFDGKTLSCLKFKHQFNLTRGDGFPFDRLFSRIDAELAAGRKVIVSLPSGNNFWHMYVIDKKTVSGEYIAYSRYYNSKDVIIKNDVKNSIYGCRGTDILTYTIVD